MDLLLPGEAVEVQATAFVAAGGEVTGTVVIPDSLMQPENMLVLLFCGVEEVLWEDVLYEEYIDYTGHQRTRYQQRWRHHAEEACEMQRQVIPRPLALTRFSFGSAPDSPQSLDCRYLYASSLNGEMNLAQPIHWLARVSYKVVALYGTTDSVERWEKRVLQKVFTTPMEGTNAVQVPPPHSTKWTSATEQPAPLFVVAPKFNTADVQIGFLDWPRRSRSQSGGFEPLPPEEVLESTVHIKTLLFISRGQIRLTISSLQHPLRFGSTAVLPITVTNGSSVSTDSIAIRFVREVCLRDAWGYERKFVHPLHETYYNVQCPARSETVMVLECVLSPPTADAAEDAEVEEPEIAPGCVASLSSSSQLFGGDFDMRVTRSKFKTKTSQLTGMDTALPSFTSTLITIAYYLRVSIKVPWTTQDVVVTVPVCMEPGAPETPDRSIPSVDPDHGRTSRASSVKSVQETGEIPTSLDTNHITGDAEQPEPIPLAEENVDGDEQKWLLEFELQCEIETAKAKTKKQRQPRQRKKEATAYADEDAKGFHQALLLRLPLEDRGPAIAHSPPASDQGTDDDDDIAFADEHAAADREAAERGLLTPVSFASEEVVDNRRETPPLCESLDEFMFSAKNGQWTEKIEPALVD
eukprot:TRINITY_DN21658_c0_g1_i1.p1 TRINITY_DN21658_c0_g1~~TRINITY_DN21658_c0_g1_i1.p1  ORF type:complete len:650 (-),score=98.82 TRINITY_DN21658_c0_g1_i1:5-1915(-)